MYGRILINRIRDKTENVIEEVQSVLGEVEVQVQYMI